MNQDTDLEQQNVFAADLVYSRDRGLSLRKEILERQTSGYQVGLPTHTHLQLRSRSFTGPTE